MGRKEEWRRSYLFKTHSQNDFVMLGVRVVIILSMGIKSV